MRTRTLAVAATLASLTPLTVDAVVRAPRTRSDPPMVTAGRAHRAYRPTAVAAPDRMAASGLVGWTAMIDRDTDVPVRMWGHSSPTVGAVANPAIAEAAARAFLATHLALLAPGAAVSDFVLVSNQVTNGIRSVGFQQYAGGLRVVGGAIGFAFQADRLAMVSSTALPNVTVARPSQLIARTAAFANAQRWLATSGFAATSRDPASLSSVDPVIMPIVRPRTAKGSDIAFHLAHQLAVEDAARQERWNVWVDATTGAPVARVATVSRGIGQVLYNVPVRGPQGARASFPAALASLTVDGVAMDSDLDGNVSFTGAGPVPVTLGLVGPRVAITNAAGSLFSLTKSLRDGKTVTFARLSSPLVDAQLAAFTHANLVKQYTKTRLDPAQAFVDQTLSVVVNEADVCNAFSTGDDIHFFKGGNLDIGGGTVLHCENTARIADVVYHEFGHSLHFHAIIEGVGAFDGAMSEGLSDFLSSLITNSSGLAPGFFTDQPDTPLRDLDPVGTEKVFPQDATGEPHNDGEIIGESLFDLKKALEAKLGTEAGRAQIEKIFYTIMQRSVDLPSSYAEALIGDDDDGDLSNGTPNKCEIDSAFAIHGLADPALVLGINPPTRDGFTITASVTPPSGACANLPTLAEVAVDFNLRGSTDVQRVLLTQNGTTFSGAIPTQPDGSVVQYKVTYTLSNGSSITFPTGNPADPTLEFYVGLVRPIQCFDFEAGAQGWTGDAQWKAGTPLGLGGDPDVAHGGTGVFGLDIDEDGVYAPSVPSFAESPEIDLKGAKKVRLQYYRWLTVEDGVFDQARIVVNGSELYANLVDQGATSHTDRDWRFHDVDLTAVATTGKVKLRFELDNDGFIELGGWTLDDVCVVEMIDPGCGNKVIESGEACDDGNKADGDGCSATCQVEQPEPPPPDEPMEETDTGCCSTTSEPYAPIGLALVTGSLLVRRRRRGAN